MALAGQPERDQVPPVVTGNERRPGLRRSGRAAALSDRAAVGHPPRSARRYRLGLAVERRLPDRDRPGLGQPDLDLHRTSRQCDPQLLLTLAEVTALVQFAIDQYVDRSQPRIDTETGPDLEFDGGGRRTPRRPDTGRCRGPLPQPVVRPVRGADPVAQLEVVTARVQSPERRPPVRVDVSVAVTGPQRSSHARPPRMPRRDRGAGSAAAEVRRATARAPRLASTWASMTTVAAAESPAAIASTIATCSRCVRSRSSSVRPSSRASLRYRSALSQSPSRVWTSNWLCEAV